MSRRYPKSSGVCKQHRRVRQIERLARQGFGVKRSSVSRGFVRASAAEVERRFDDERFAVIFIDAQPYADPMMVVALGITTAGEKRLLGLRQGATGNATVVTSLLEELRERGVRTDVPTLFVLDGAKALRAAVIRVWGKFAVIQRCQVHKRRNTCRSSITTNCGSDSRPRTTRRTRPKPSRCSVRR